MGKLNDFNPADAKHVIDEIRRQVRSGLVRIAQHAQQEMAEEEASLNEVLEALAAGDLVENYPEHRRGACCLVTGQTRCRRTLHVVVTTTLPLVIVLTAYEPKPPKWLSPTERSR